MSDCCAHDETEHHLLAICQEVIHYPSEDYPCLCTGLAGAGEQCSSCNHPRDSHQPQRVCRPLSGELCGCSR